MQAIPNKIVVGDEESPIAVFDNASIESVIEETAVSIIGDELFIDQLIPNVMYHVYIRYVFKPTDYKQFVTRNGLVMCCHYTYDIRKLPYATPVTFYSNGMIQGRYYCETVDRIGKDMYKLKAISAIGLMDRQRSVGGLFNGQKFQDVLRDILGEEYQYEVSDDVAKVIVY